MDFDSIDSPTDCALIVCFCDATDFAKVCQRKSSNEMFELMSRYFELAGDTVEPAGGRIVKFLGDGMFVVFPEDRAKQAIEALKELQRKVARLFREQGFECALRVKAHIGPVTCGLVGTRNDKRFDVFGDHVNSTARLQGGDFSISPELQEDVSS